MIVSRWWVLREAEWGIAENGRKELMLRQHPPRRGFIFSSRPLLLIRTHPHCDVSNLLTAQPTPDKLPLLPKVKTSRNAKAGNLDEMTRSVFCSHRSDRKQEINLPQRLGLVSEAVVHTSRRGFPSYSRCERHVVLRMRCYLAFASEVAPRSHNCSTGGSNHHWHGTVAQCYGFVVPTRQILLSWKREGPC